MSTLIFGALLAVFIVDTVIDSGAFKKIEPHFEGSCSIVEGVVGAEDITIDQSSGLAFISAHDRRNWSDGGGIYTYQTGSYAQPALMPHDLGETLYPHGIYLWKNNTGADRLFVVNHPPATAGSEQRSDSEVIIFEIINHKLQKIKTLKTDFPYSLNDLAAIDGERFFATIDRGSITRLSRMFEVYGRLARGGIAYGTSEGITKLVDGLVFPNGIQVGSGSKRVYVSESTGERLLTFTRDETTDELSLLAETPIDTGLDNLEWDNVGNLWVGAHPQMLKFLAHGRSSSNRSASQVLRINLNQGMSIDEIYLNRGEVISGSSVGAPYQGHLLIGSVFEPFILDCKLSDLSTQNNE